MASGVLAVRRDGSVLFHRMMGMIGDWEGRQNSGHYPNLVPIRSQRNKILQRILIAQECVVEIAHQHEGDGDGDDEGQSEHISGHVAVDAYHIFGDLAVETQRFPETDEVGDGENQDQVAHDEAPAIVEGALAGISVIDEPGLYVAEEGIGIRLENDILVTEGAPEDLVGDRLLNISDIKNLMA